MAPCLTAPLVLLGLTAVLCRGAKDSACVNTTLTALKLAVVATVLCAGLPRTDPELWHPFSPAGTSAVLSTAATVFFSYIGFDAVASAAEEARRPRRDIPAAILVSLAVCAGLYVLVVVTLTGLTDYKDLNSDAPLADAMKAAGFGTWMQATLNLGAVAGLSTTLLVGLYSQARIYVDAARSGLLPARLATVDPATGAPRDAQVLCGLLAAPLAALFDVKRLAAVLNVGVLLAYAVCCAAVLSLRAVAHADRWLALKATRIAVAALAAAAWASRAAAPAAVVVVLLCAGAVAAATPLAVGARFTASDKGDGSFRVPFLPAVPMLGVLANAGLMALLPWPALVRLLASFLVVPLWYCRHRLGKRRAEAQAQDELRTSATGSMDVGS